MIFEARLQDSGDQKSRARIVSAATDLVTGQAKPNIPQVAHLVVKDPAETSAKWRSL